MRILQINAFYKLGSTGKIVKNLMESIEKSGDECFVLAGYSNVSAENVYSFNILPVDISLKKNIFVSRCTGVMGYRNIAATKKALKWIDKINPDLIHLHNIHGDWINVRLLINYIKEKKIPVIWTLHDCWSFTGRCSNFEFFNCYKWESGCGNCQVKSVYPVTYCFDFSKKMWKDKKNWFNNIENMTIVTPSNWLSEYVKKSFLFNYPLEVINNGINNLIYFPREKEKDLDASKKIILGVASSWTERKGLYDFVKLDKIIDHSKYQILLVGLTKNQMDKMPKTIECMGKTSNEEELAKIYSNASIFINPTYQDNYPTTNLEAQACGTPCITYKTGGSTENVMRKKWVVEQGDIVGLRDKIIELSEKDYLNELIEYSKLLSEEIMYQKYIELYKRVLCNKS